MRRAFGGWRSGRSMPAFTSSCPAARPARARRSPRTSACASSSSSSRKRRAGAGPRAGAGGYDTHEVVHVGEAHAEGRRAGHPVGHAVLQQADARRALPALQRDRRRASGCRSSSTTCPGRTGCNVDARRSPAWRRSRTSSASRKRPATSRRCARSAARVPKTSSCCRETTALTLPVMAVGGRGIISVASNERAGEMAKMVELAEANDFAAARRIHATLMPFLTVNFIESNPIPIKSGHGGDGPARGGNRLPMVPPRDASRRRSPPCSKQLRGTPCTMTLERIDAPSKQGARRPIEARALVEEFRARLVDRRDPRGRARRIAQPAGASTSGSSTASCSGSGSAIPST